MARNWKGLEKAAEECGELVVELMKLKAFPDGKHPGRRRSVILSTEEELADVLAIVEYFAERNKFDLTKIDKRKLLKKRKFAKWWGLVPSMKKKKAPARKKVKKNKRP